METYKLDNPVWYALQETHKDKCLGLNNGLFYDPEYCPFGGFVDLETSALAVKLYSNFVSNFFVVGNRPQFENDLILKNELVCDQMVLEKDVNLDFDVTLTRLGLEHNEALCSLVNLVQPGYFKSKTSTLGQYYGILKDSKLVAVTGERMQMDSFTEISAVVTHPDYKGLGYAKNLVAHASKKILEQHKSPFLHVAETNAKAIGLYEKLGYKFRRKISFWNLIKPEL